MGPSQVAAHVAAAHRCTAVNVAMTGLSSGRSGEWFDGPVQGVVSEDVDGGEVGGGEDEGVPDQEVAHGVEEVDVRHGLLLPRVGTHYRGQVHRTGAVGAGVLLPNDCPAPNARLVEAVLALEREGLGVQLVARTRHEHGQLPLQLQLQLSAHAPPRAGLAATATARRPVQPRVFSQRQSIQPGGLVLPRLRPAAALGLCARHGRPSRRPPRMVRLVSQVLAAEEAVVRKGPGRHGFRVRLFAFRDP
mmetsp:Transcript_66082/g.149143  ORF Transcript_66082/g.149143 Transcript_66082/m.149143 type:complete len:247 (-) Transcript_66082:542-1282(-)